MKTFVAVLAVFWPAFVLAAPVDYARDVQPLLSAKCYECHSAKKTKGELRLDSREAAFRGGESGPALSKGKSAESEIIKRVTSSDPDERMPSKGDRLTDAEIDTLRRWIDAGAEWPDALAGNDGADKLQHWAFRAPVRPPVPAFTAGSNLEPPSDLPDAGKTGSSPEVSNRKSPGHPIDAFIGVRLAKEGLAFAPPAERTTLLRRVHFDLTGLPPTQPELAAFLADRSAAAIEKVIDRQLASPHFGERWARHWLDVARYADSQGYEKDPARYSVWFWRDWVINAINADLPYDRFIIEQLAGDLLPHAMQDQIVATGFLRQSMVNEEGGVDPEQFRMEAMFDRMDCLGKAVLGLTIQCAQCHNHKFDPITQEDYYRVFAFLNNDHEPQRVVYSPTELRQIGTVRSQMKETEARLRESMPDWATRQAAWEADLKKQPQPQWQTVTGEFEPESTGGCKYLPRPDGSFLAQSYAPTKSGARLITKTTLPKITAFRLELMNDANLPCNGPGRSFKGTCALTEFKVQIDRGKKDLDDVKLASAEADFADAPDSPLEPNFYDKSDKKRVTGPAAYAIDGDDKTAWGIDAGAGRRNQPRVIIFKPAQPLEDVAGRTLNLVLVQNHGGWNSDDLMNNNLGRFRLSVTDAEVVPAPAVSQRAAAALAVDPAQRDEGQQETIFAQWRASAPECAEATGKIEALWTQWPQGSTALTLQSRGEPRLSSILKRGDWLNPGKAVTPGVPVFLHQPPKNAPPNRLTLARWLVARESPTTARTYVNRVWGQLFGTGFVPSVEDLGLQSEPPSHPELLDWLAVEFMEQGWSLKRMLRLVLTSRTYQQSSTITSEAIARDPYNRLFARGPRLRVEAEIVRDVALASSGLLNRKVGGPSVMAPAPEFLFQPPASYAPFPWKNAEGTDKYRRALYTFRRRSTPYPVLQTFDAPNGDQACVRRSRSNSPLQALITLNEELFVDCARALGHRMLAEGGATTEERVRWAFREVVSREPTPAEINRLIVLAARQTKRLVDKSIDPAAVATGSKDGAKELPPGTTAGDWATTTVLARVLLNLDETITKE
jgi:mono/diheme cytochrome c family protein